MLDLSLFLMDIVQNSIDAGSSIIKIFYNTSYNNNNILTVNVTDNGHGINKDILPNVFIKNFTTSPFKNKGNGLYKLKSFAESTGGSINIISEENRGTSITLKLKTASSNILPIGDTATTLWLLTVTNPMIDFHFKLCTTLGIREFKTNYFKQFLIEGIVYPHKSSLLMHQVIENTLQTLQSSEYNIF